MTEESKASKGWLASAAQSVRYEHLMAGFSGGVVSTLVLHPLDLLKIRFAVDSGRAASRPHYSGLRDACVSILRDEGVRGFYRGVTPNVTGAGTAWGLYLLFFNSIKSRLQQGRPEHKLSPLWLVAAATQAGVLTQTLTNPIWVVKTRLCLQYGKTDAALGPSRSYSGMADAFVKIARFEGIRGLYKGYVPGLIGVSHGVVQFVAYEEMKSAYNQSRARAINEKLTSFEYLLFAALSKLLAALTTYPTQVIKARLQDQRGDYSGTWECVVRTLRYEGIQGMYKGFSPYLVHVMPNICIVLLIYEHVAPNRQL